MSEVVVILGTIIDELSTKDEVAPQPVIEPEEAKGETVEEADTESITKQGNKNLKKVFDIRDMVNFRNKSIGKLDWRNWTPGLVRT